MIESVDSGESGVQLATVTDLVHQGPSREF